MIWRIRLNFVLICIATAALATAFCIEGNVKFWQLATAGIVALGVGIYGGLWLSFLPIDKLKEITSIQCTDGTWNFNAYHLGMANGLVLALAILEDKEPEFLEAPDKWLENGRGIVSGLMEVTYDTIDGKWWMFMEGAAIRPLTDEEAAKVIWE
jgi:hypothetical protein